ncbi:MAG: hypothetical protein LBR05_07660 [Azoarcus sp.]|jgi:hypothetical protein|nr:hypothetical protein [Azoarcus sp.]
MPGKLALLLAALALPAAADAVDASWQGATFAGDKAALQKLAAAGAKVVRVYGESDAWVLDEAAKLGLGVVMGLDVGLPRRGFNLDDASARARQEERIAAFVRRHRRHPALKAWAIGNEVEHEMPDPLPAWREVERLAAVVKALDGAHPTMMVVADGGAERLRPLATCCAHVDFLGINLYADAVFGIGERLRAVGVDKPVFVTELGPLGQWQAGRKPWGAPVELTSRQKADYFRRVYADAAKRADPQVRGFFPFLWGAKQEQTATWHGLLLADGTLTEMTDALAAAWGRPPAQAAPTILGIGIAADEFAPGGEVSSTIDARGDGLETAWQVRREASQLLGGGDVEPVPAAVGVEMLHADALAVRFRAPAEPGAYRLFITVRDKSGKAATANLPFLVR